MMHCTCDYSVGIASLQLADIWGYPDGRVAIPPVYKHLFKMHLEGNDCHCKLSIEQMNHTSAISRLHQSI